MENFKEYIVTLYRSDDLEDFYSDMEKEEYKLLLKRPMSRNTHYLLTEAQAEELKKDTRVWGVEPIDIFNFKTTSINNNPYKKNGTFWKGGGEVAITDFQWGHLHCTGTAEGRGKGVWGSPVPTVTGASNTKDAEVNVFNGGKHVDVVIVDDPISHDLGEWLDPSGTQTRFVTYQWFNELNSLVQSIDDDGQSRPTGEIVYNTGANNPYYHGNHVGAIACGKYYGWAREANIYNLAITNAWSTGQKVPGLLVFDYLRAFHLNKPINPETGFRNPTITNHSYVSQFYQPMKAEGGTQVGRYDFADIEEVKFRNVLYGAPNQSEAHTVPTNGWNQETLERDFGVRFGSVSYLAYSPSVAADVQDAINDGVVVIGGAGNANLLIAEGPEDPDWDNYIKLTETAVNLITDPQQRIRTFNYCRGGSPNLPNSGSIIVGNLSDDADFKRHNSSMFGPGIDIFAPGENILSAWTNPSEIASPNFNGIGLADSKYSVNNWFYPVTGASQASPQVAGVIALLASGKPRFTQADAINYLNKHSIYDDMTFNISGGGFDDSSCQKGSPNKYLHAKNPRPNLGHLDTPKGQRPTSGVLFPRKNVLNTP